MDFSLPVAKRTRSKEAYMYQEFHKNLKKKKVVIDGSESMSHSASTFKEDESVKLHGDSAVHDVCEEESANVGEKNKGKSIFSEGMDDMISRRKDKGKSFVSEGMDDAMIDDSDEDVVFLGEKDDLSADEPEDVVCLDDEEDVFGESSSFYSNNVNENGGSKIGHEGSSDEDGDLEEYSDDAFSSEDDTDDEDYVVEKSNSSVMVEDTNSSGEEEEENFVDESEVVKRGSGSEGEKLRRAENLSSSSVDEEGEEEGDDDQIEDTERICDNRRTGRRVEEEFNVFIDSDNTEDNEINENTSVNVGGKRNCAAKHTRSHVVSEFKIKKTELGTASSLFFVDEEDSDNDDDQDTETGRRDCKTGAKKWTIRPGRGNNDKGKFGKSKIKHNSTMKGEEVKEILLSSILDVERIPLEESLFRRNEEVLTGERSPFDDETCLPLKFNFGNEEPTPPEKSEFEKDLDSLWTQMENSCVNVGGKRNCVAKHTRSHVVSEFKIKKTELGTTSSPFFVDEEDNDNDDGKDTETGRRDCKTGAKKWTIRPGRGNNDKGKFGKSKIKHNSTMKGEEVKEVLLSSILDVERIPPEESLFRRNEEVLIEERSPFDDETCLPLKFNFGNEEPTPPEKSEFEKDLDSLWTQMENSCVNVGGKRNCVAKHTRSHVVSEFKIKKTELGTTSSPFFVDEEDNDNDDGKDTKTGGRDCKTGAKKWTIRPGKGNNDKGKFGKSNIKHNYRMKGEEVKEILLSSILDGEGIPLEESLFPRNEEVLIEERSPFDDETCLPLKFNFGNEEPTPLEKSEFEKDLDSLWTQMDFALAASAIGSTDSSVNKNEVEPAPEVKHHQSTCCSQGKHQLILDEEVGIICKFCSFVKLEIRYIVPSFAKNPWERYRRGSKVEDDSVLGGGLHCQDSGFDSQTGLDSCSQQVEEGTVWDLVPGVKNSMYAHQREGFEFIWRNIAGGIDLDKLKHSTISDGSGNGCIISHAPGTGKTRLAIVFVQAYMKMYPACRPVIIAPCNMLLTWEEEFKKWRTGITFHNLNNPVASGKELLEIRNPDKSLLRTMKILSWKKGGGVLGISYSRFKILVGGTTKKSREVDGQMRKILLELPGLVVLDEGHIPRNSQTEIFKALSEIQTERRIILSGTPFQNNFEELFNTFYLVRPKFADGMQSGSLRYSVRRRGRCKKNSEKGKWTYLTSSIGKVADDRLADEKRLNELRTIITPFVHVYKGTVLQESLPGLRQSVVVLRPFDLQKQLLEGVEGEIDMIKRNLFVSLISAHPSLLLDQSYDHEDFINNMSKLQRIRLDPEAGIKTKFLMELLRLSTALNEKVLVFSQYLKPLSLIGDQLCESFNWIEGREVLYMDGTQDVRLRQSKINIFNDPSSKIKVLLASTKACGEGINLVGASRVVLLDVAWNPSVDRQAISRAYRLGQKKIVHVYHLITSGTMEEKKCYRQAKKDWLSNSVFISSHGEGGDRKISSNTTLEDKILEEMVQHDRLKYIENIIEEYDESKLIDTFGLEDR